MRQPIIQQRVIRNVTNAFVVLLYNIIYVTIPGSYIHRETSVIEDLPVSYCHRSNASERIKLICRSNRRNHSVQRNGWHCLQSIDEAQQIFLIIIKRLFV